jgi:hypothetical protein
VKKILCKFIKNFRFTKIICWCGWFD